jgi:hypothetical protein
MTACGGAEFGELRAAGWPAPEHPECGEDTEFGGRDTIVDRLSDEASWLRQCADWLAHLDAARYQSAASLRPAADWPDRAVVPVDLARVRAVIDQHRRRHGRVLPGPAVQDLGKECVTEGEVAEGFWVEEIRTAVGVSDDLVSCLLADQRDYGLGRAQAEPGGQQPAHCREPVRNPLLRPGDTLLTGTPVPPARRVHRP